VARDQIERYVIARAAVYRNDLSASEADAEVAIIGALDLWRSVLGNVRRTDRVVTTLAAVGTYLLEPSGQNAVLRVCEEDPGREILRWRFASLALPSGIYVAAAVANHVAPNSDVRLLNQSIAPDGCVAQLHVHHAAMLSFDELWSLLGFTALLAPGQLVRTLQNRRAFCPQLHPGICGGGKSKSDRNIGARRPIDRAMHMAEWADLVRQSFIAIRVLERHLWHDEKLLSQCDRCERGIPAGLRQFARGRMKPYAVAATAYPWPDDLVSIRREWRKAEVSLRDHPPLPLRGGLQEDVSREQTLIRRCFKYLRPERELAPDLTFEELFVQYLRVKTAVFGLLVHAPGEHGLEKFLDHFTQIKVYAPAVETLRPLPPMEHGLTVASVEYRVAPDAWLTTHRHVDFPAAFSNCAPRCGPTAAGPRRHPRKNVTLSADYAWLIHFKREKPAEGVLPLFGSVVQTLEADARKVIGAIMMKPQLLRSLRGLDLCGVEDHQPLWVCAETLRRVRQASRRIAANRAKLNLEPLRLTLHAGEDFTWLTSGVRAIAEPFLWSLIERGDRIGHGIAITLEPTGWWDRRQGRVIDVPQLQRFLDLAFLAKYAHSRSRDQERWIERNLRLAVSAIWPQLAGSQDVVSTAVEFWQLLGGRLPRIFMRMTKRPSSLRPAERWLYSYLWNRSTRSRAEATTRVAVEDDRGGLKGVRTECDLLTKARAKLIGQVARWQVCIEANPTSNLLVGSLDAMAAQDFLQRRPTAVTRPGEETLTWTISTDDPITFSTTLADEYAYAWAGMVLRENDAYDPAYARALLDEAAATSMRMRFTIPNDDRNDRPHRPGRRER